MFEVAEYASDLYRKAALWDKVKASAQLGSTGKWELTVGGPHSDPEISAAFERWVKGR
jgi:hypothetical protein